MADEKTIENHLPTRLVFNDIYGQELHNPKNNENKKRTFSELGDQYEVNDEVLLKNTEHKNKKRKISIDIESVDLDKCSKISQTDAIKLLTSVIEEIENKILACNKRVGDNDVDSQCYTNQEGSIEPSFNQVDEFIDCRKITNCNHNSDNIMYENVFKTSVDEKKELLSELTSIHKFEKLENHKIIKTKILESEICDVNYTKSIYGQDKNCLESIHPLKKNTVLVDVTNSLSVNEDKKHEKNDSGVLIGQNLLESSSTSHKLITHDDMEISTRMNNDNLNYVKTKDNEDIMCSSEAQFNVMSYSGNSECQNNHEEKLIKSPDNIKCCMMELDFENITQSKTYADHNYEINSKSTFNLENVTLTFPRTVNDEILSDRLGIKSDVCKKEEYNKNNNPKSNEEHTEYIKNIDGVILKSEKVDGENKYYSDKRKKIEMHAHLLEESNRSDVKLNSEQVEELIKSMISDVLLDMEGIGAPILDKYKTCKCDSVIITYQEENLLKSNKNVNDDTIMMLDIEKNQNEINAENVSESQGSFEPSTIIYYNKINRSGDSIISSDHKLIESTEQLNDLITLDSENVVCCINEEKIFENCNSLSIHQQKEVLELPRNEVDEIQSCKDNTECRTCDDDFYKISLVIDNQDMIDLTKYSSDENLLENEYNALSTNNKLSVCEINLKSIPYQENITLPININNDDEILMDAEKMKWNLQHKTKCYENNFDVQDLIDLTIYSNNEIMLEDKNDIIRTNNESGVCKQNKLLLSSLSCSNLINQEEMMTFELSKNVADTILLESDENIANVENDDKICERSPRSYDGQFTLDMFFFGSENCCDIPVNNITQSSECYKIKKFKRNKLSTHLVEFHANFISKDCSDHFNENSIVKPHKENEALLETYLAEEMYNDDDLVVSLIEEVIENIIVSLISSNSLCLGSLKCSTPLPCSSPRCNQNINSYVNEIIDSDNCLLALNDKNLSFCVSEAEQSLESSNSNSVASDISLMFQPSDRDLAKYGINLSTNTEESLIFREKMCFNTCKSQLKSSKEFNSIKGYVLKGSSVQQDFEDNDISFYDCDLSSIENSDVEDNHLTLSSEDESSLDHSNEQMKSSKYSNPKDQNEHNKGKNFNFSSESYSKTTVMECHNNNHNKILSENLSKNQIPDDSGVLTSEKDIQCCTINPIIKLCKLNSSDNQLESASNCTKSGFNNIDKNIPVDYDVKMHKNLDSDETDKTLGNKNISDERLDLNKSISLFKTINKSSKDNELDSLNQSNVKDTTNIVDTNDLDDSISPYISQSVAKISKSQNLKKALAKKASSNTNVRDMGDKALCTYLTQQTMTLDVLEVLYKSLDTCPSSDVLMEDPKGLMVPLMPHQKHALAWLMWRESQKQQGGIFADDMGLGKTLSMISLVLKSEEKQDVPPDVSSGVISGGSLVVCPVSLISQWQNEVKTKLIPGLLKLDQYYGINKKYMSATELAKCDIVITSYHAIMWAFKKQKDSCPLFKINWKRIILDEAHVIRNHKTQTTYAVCNLTSIYRWAITGTPINNKEADFFTLLKFLRCKPFDEWTVWRKWVGNNDDAGRHRLSLLVKTLMLRRTKEELSHFASFKLPCKSFHTIEIQLSKEERNAYEQLLQFSSKLFASYLYDRAAKEKVFNNNSKIQCTAQYFQEQSKKKEVFKDHPELQKLFRQFKNINEVQTYHILLLLLRLRQICCHPCLIKGKVTEENIDEDERFHILDNENDIDNDEIGSSTYNENSIIVPTQHFGFVEELTNIMSCLTLESKSNEKIDSNLIFKKSWLSSKIKAVCDMVREKVLYNGCKDKAIIVSQWPSMLRIIRLHLSQYNINTEIFSGEVSVLKRNEIVHKFNDINGGPQILLLSLTSGGVGLNLIAANHMFLMDIHWNPQLEAQVCDRIYRLGQIKPVNVYKFICANTIETRILMIQSMKLEIADNIFKGAKANSSNITLDDLKEIFQCH